MAISAVEAKPQLTGPLKSTIGELLKLKPGLDSALLRACEIKDKQRPIAEQELPQHQSNSFVSL